MIQIRKKVCKNCHTPQFIFSHGRCRSCAAREDSKPMTRTIKERNSEDKIYTAELERWFTERRSEMTGKCRHCQAKTSKDSDRYFKCSIAHILPKRLFKSVATHRLNWVELCFWSNSCHTNFDNGIIDLIELNCWDEVITKFQEMYSSIDPKERKYIPEVLMQFINVDV